MSAKQVTGKKKTPAATEPYGDQLSFCEPQWYQGFASPYYRKSHMEFRDTVRKFVAAEISPNVDEWIKKGERYPNELHLKAYRAGINGLLFPVEYGGTRPADFDAFHELVLWDELSRAGGGGVLGQLSIDSMALPPIIHYGSKYLKDLILRPVIEGRKHVSLMISEPTAGSDVAAIRTTATREGNFFRVNGTKKWITGAHVDGMIGYTTAVVMEKGISLLFVPRDLPGLTVRKMETMFDTTHGTNFVTMEDVMVPVENIIGEEGQGLIMIMTNFNHERFVIAVGVLRSSRMCYSEAIHEALTRKTFGKRLIEHQIIRFKLAEMARQIEALQAYVESIAYQFSQGVKDRNLGSQCALLKVQATKTFEYCAREAVQIFGGSGLVKEGRGAFVERLYREVRGVAIPGGSEEILLDLAIREAVKSAL